MQDKIQSSAQDKGHPNPPKEEQADVDYEAKEHDGVVEDNEVNADDQDELQYQQVISVGHGDGLLPQDHAGDGQNDDPF